VWRQRFAGAGEDVTIANLEQTSEKLCLSLQGHIYETWGLLSGADKDLNLLGCGAT
jgi:hypothetical protein